MPRDYASILESELRAAGLDISPDRQRKLSLYCSELERWNQKINLTSLSGEALVKRLVVEPAWVGETLGMSGVLLDIGSGNGSPAVPLCISRPFDRLFLVEVRARRAAFLRHLISTLQLDSAEVHKTRFEDLRIEVPRIDWITFQAVFPTAELLQNIKAMAGATTKVVWITSAGSDSPAPVTKTVKLPSSNTEIRLLTLDRS